MLNERIGSSMERSEMTDEEFEARALYDEYQEELCHDRTIREERDDGIFLGWASYSFKTRAEYMEEEEDE